MIVDHHLLAEKLDDDEAGPDDWRRTACRGARGFTGAETLECRGTVPVAVAGPRYSLSAASAGGAQDSGWWKGRNKNGEIFFYDTGGTIIEIWARSST